jgi:hypothetical protein
VIYWSCDKNKEIEKKWDVKWVLRKLECTCIINNNITSLWFELWTTQHAKEGKEETALWPTHVTTDRIQYNPFIYMKVVTIDSAQWNIIVCTSAAQPSSLCLETPWIVITCLAFTSMWSYFILFTEDPNVSLLSQTSKFRANWTFEVNCLFCRRLWF